MNEFTKPIPVPDADSAPFWDGTRAHKLLIQRCTNCGTLRFPARKSCGHCHSDASDWTEVSGKGRVYSWIVVNHPVPREVYGQEVPYVVALIDLDEGVRMVSNIIGCDVHAVTAEMPVEVVFEAGQGGMVLPKFKPQA
ncbi:hypothetical protein FHS85_001012 [Rhodoligotrophos appendicifer]|uniref:Zn-ribbon domain-containing OB-fold protein n=1 Tax=Rhodoligotrophos appendicifer TaxID=987056 RepID=UPI00117CD6EE|nr:Zn-ribbon domain-containing OB-fold protein [Rhodoligotrophos appendicifer]